VSVDGTLEGNYSNAEQNLYGAERLLENCGKGFSKTSERLLENYK